MHGTPFASNVSPMNHYKMSRAQQICNSNDYPSGSKDGSSLMKCAQPELQPFAPAGMLQPPANVIDWQLVPARVEEGSPSNEQERSNDNDKDLML